MKVARFAFGSAVAAAAILGMSLPAGAAVLYSTGFEPPTFTTGDVNGQDGWMANTSVYAAQVENSFAYAGTQALDVDPYLAGAFGGAYKTVNTTAPIVEQSAEIWLDSSTSQAAYQFGALGPNLVGFAGGIDIDSDDTIHLITKGFTVVGTFTRDQWNKVDVVLDYATQTFSVALNGATLASNVHFCGDNGLCAGGPIAAYSNGLFETFGGTNYNDLGFMDDYSVSSVPLPTSAPMFGAALLVLGAVGYGLKRRAAAPV